MTAIFGAIDTMKPALDFHMARQNLIASNIANVDTPGYVSSELVRTEDFGDSMKMAGLERTDKMHLGGISSSHNGQFIVEKDEDQVAGNDMNKVSMEREMSRLAANTLKYEAVGKVIAKQIGILKYAASDARN